MNTTTKINLPAIIIVFLMLSASLLVAAAETSPVRLPEDKLAGVNLGEFSPWPAEMILSGLPNTLSVNCSPGDSRRRLPGKTDQAEYHLTLAFR